MSIDNQVAYEKMYPECKPSTSSAPNGICESSASFVAQGLDPAYKKTLMSEVFGLGQGDPWAHRSAGMHCSSCMWYVAKVGPGMGERVVGRCRRHAPTMGGYPVVFPNDWCGDHRLDEGKVNA